MIRGFYLYRPPKDLFFEKPDGRYFPDYTKAYVVCELGWFSRHIERISPVIPSGAPKFS